MKYSLDKNAALLFWATFHTYSTDCHTNRASELMAFMRSTAFGMVADRTQWYITIRNERIQIVSYLFRTTYSIHQPTDKQTTNRGCKMQIARGNILHRQLKPNLVSPACKTAHRHVRGRQGCIIGEYICLPVSKITPSDIITSRGNIAVNVATMSSPVNAKNVNDVGLKDAPLRSLFPEEPKPPVPVSVSSIHTKVPCPSAWGRLTVTDTFIY